MRRINDKEAYIKEIQRFLMRALENSGIVFENGIYDEVTKRAVIRFKRENGMSEDTVVDRETYELLYTKYSESSIGSARIMRRADRGDDVLMLNSMLRTVTGAYSDIVRPSVSSYYSEVTESSVRALRERFMMGDSGEADHVFVERLKKEYELTREETEIVR